MRTSTVFAFCLLALATSACAAKEPAVRAKAAVPGRSIPALAAADRAYAAGDLASAERWYGKAIESEPSSTEARYLRARVRIDLGDLDGAEADLAVALSNDPNHWEAMSLRGVLLERQGRRTEAWIALRDARNLAPHALPPRNNLAFLALLEGHHEDAYESLVALSQEFPRSARVWNNLSIAAERLGKTEEAERARLEAARLGEQR